MFIDNVAEWAGAPLSVTAMSSSNLTIVESCFGRGTLRNYLLFACNAFDGYALCQQQ